MLTVTHVTKAVNIILIMLLLSISPSVFSYDQDWNGGKEDITQPDGENPDGDNHKDEAPPESCNQKSSPVYAARGFLVWTEKDISFPGSTRVELERTYNSYDRRAGLFGRGWVSPLEVSIARTYKAVTEGNADGSPTTATEFEPVPILLTEYGRRYTLAETESGCTTPDVLFFTFEKTEEGGFKQIYENSQSYQIFSDRGVLLESYSDKDGSTIYYEYDEDGRLVKQVDSYGMKLTFDYNEQGFVSEVTDNIGRTWKYAYDLYGNLEQMIDPDGNTREYAYQLIDKTGYKQHLLTDITYNIDDPVLNVTWSEVTFYGKTAMRVSSYSEFDTLRHHYAYSQYHYDGNPVVRVIKYTRFEGVTSFQNIEQNTYYADPDSYLIVYQYNSRDYLTTTKAYNERGMLLSVSRSTGGGSSRGVSYDYDELGRVITKTENSGSDNEQVVTYAYKENSDRVSVIDEFGLRKTSFEYDDHLRVAKRTIHDVETNEGRSWEYSYHTNATDSQGNVVLGKVKSIDGPLAGNSDTQSFEYNGLGMLSKVSNSLGHDISYGYNDIGQLVSETDINGVETTYAYDSRNRVSTSTRSGRSQQFVYTAKGDLESITDELGRTTTFTYDDYSQIDTTLFPTGDYIKYSYSYSHSDPYIQVEQNFYSADDELIRTGVERIHPITGNVIHEYLDTTSKNVAQNSHNAFGDITQRKQWQAVNGFNTTTNTYYDYDEFGRLERLRDGAGKDTSYAYDPFGNLVEVTDPNSATTSYGFNAFGEVSKLTSPDTGVTSYSYNALGQVTSQINANNVEMKYSYDALGRVTTIDYEGDDLDTSISYDEGDFAKGQVSHVSDGSGSVSYSYDNRGLVAGVNNEVAGVQLDVSYEYDDTGALTAITYPSGRKIAYAFDAFGRLGSVKQSVGQNENDILKNIVWNGLNLGSHAHGNGIVTTFSYDLSGRLLSKHYGSDQESLSYSLDAQGNITGNTKVINGQSTAISYQYDQLARLIRDGTEGWVYSYDAVGNRLREQSGVVGEDNSFYYDEKSNRLNEADSTAVSLDAAGNTLSDGARHYEYNAMNRLASLSHTVTGAQVKYHYNYLGQRVRKTFTSGGSSDIRYVYGLNGELLGEYDALGQAIREYVYFEENGVSELLAQIEADGSIIYVHTDHLATPRLASNDNKNIVWRWDSNAFGNTAANDDPDGDNNVVTLHHRFPGQYYDVESGLHYNYFRYYDPSLGRYVTSDPIGLEGGVNTYLYASANSSKYYDREGLSKSKLAKYALGAILAAATKLKNIIEASYKACKSVRCKIQIDGPHHFFPGHGWCPHVRLTCWRKGVKEKPFVSRQWRIPFRQCSKLKHGKGGPYREND